MKNIFGQGSETSDEHWISVSDLMAGLMVIFLFIAIAYINPIVEKQDIISKIGNEWQTSEKDIYDALKQEFKDDLPRWNAELDQERLTIRFNAPDVLFEAGEATLRQKFKRIIADFFPRYIDVLYRFEDKIEEVRIEGHTSSGWYEEATPAEAYINNMRLSQERTRSVLGYALQLPAVGLRVDWARKYLTANGLSYSHRILGPDGKEDKGRSRRVEFRVRTTVLDQLQLIIETLQ